MKTVPASVVFVALLLWNSFLTAAGPAASPPQEKSTASPGPEQGLVNLTIEKCLDLALKNNHRRPASQYAVEAAEAQHRQALSAYWPQLSARSAYTQLDDDPNFVFPSQSITVPSQAVSIPANTFAPGFPASAVSLKSPPTTFTVPQQNVKLMDKRNLASSLNLQYPLYTGGLRSAKTTQAKMGLESARQEARRTDLQIIYDAKRMYYGAALAGKLLQTGKDSLGRLETTLTLTENLYKKGSGRVKKTDFLRNKTMVEGVRTMVAHLENNDKMAKAALANTMGLEWQVPVELAGNEIPYVPYKADLKNLISSSYAFNPDWAKLKAGLQASEAQIKEARSGHLPKVALTGSLNHIDNSYNQGLVSARNKDSWMAGVVVELPLFSGFLTQNKIREARAGLAKIKEEQILLKEGLALQVKEVFYRLLRAQDQYASSREAMLAAEENRDLNERAYQNELVETKDVLEAQLLESFMQAQHYKVLYDHVEAKAHLSLVIGREINKLLE